MSYRTHPTKNRHLPLDWTGKRWWQIEYWPEGKKRVNGKVVSDKLNPIFFGTEAEVKIYEMELRSAARGSAAIQVNPPLKDIIADFKKDYKTEVTEGTLQDFVRAHNNFIDHFGNYRLTEITNTIVQQYKNLRLSQIYRSKPITKLTVNKELSYLSSIIRWAEKQDPPLVEKGKVHIQFYAKSDTRPKKPVMPHTFEEVDLLIDSIKNTSVYDQNTCNRERHKQMALDRYGMSLLMYDVGLRKKEARLIEAERVQLFSKPQKVGRAQFYGYITVIRKGGKIQSLPIITERVHNELKERLKKAKGFLYISPITQRPYVDFRNGLKEAGKRAGVNKRNNPHLFRHDFVTHLHATGTDMKSIQELAGHSVLSTTSEIYSHLTNNTLVLHAQGFAKRIRSRTELKSKKDPKKTDT